MVSILQKLRLSTPKVDAAQTDRCVFVKTSQGEWSTHKGVGEVGKNVLERDRVEYRTDRNLSETLTKEALLFSTTIFSIICYKKLFVRFFISEKG